LTYTYDPHEPTYGLAVVARPPDTQSHIAVTAIRTAARWAWLDAPCPDRQVAQTLPRTSHGTERQWPRHISREKSICAPHPETGHEPCRPKIASRSLEWRMNIVKKQSAIKTMLLDKRISDADRQILESTYDHQQRMFDFNDQQLQRNWEMEQRTREIQLDTQYRELTLQYSEASKQLAESQAKTAERYAQSADAQATSLKHATWVLAGATIALVIATFALVVVTVTGSPELSPMRVPSPSPTRQLTRH
jgi:hypothetical protein